MPVLRKAQISDAGPLAKLAEQTFRDTFAPMNTVKDMNLHCQTSYGEVIQAEEIADPNMVTLLSEQDGQLIGFVQLRWGDAPPCVFGNDVVEIQRLYVAREWHGKGVAQALMAEAVQVAKFRGADRVWLGVWEHNPRAISFYQKFGFVEVGEHKFLLGCDLQRDIVMVRSIL